MKKTVKILGREYDTEKTTFLNLSYKGLTKIPKEINELINLEELYLSNNKIEKIENLDNLINLKYLHLYNNEIEKIEGLDNNKNLEILDIKGNKIEIIENIHHLEKLKDLYLFNNLEKLKDLYLFGIPYDIEEAKRISLINSRSKKLSLI